MIIRDETDADLSAITNVTIAAFETLEISHKTEQYIIEALRAANAMVDRDEDKQTVAAAAAFLEHQIQDPE